MNILQALFFPPEQPGGVSSMVPYIQEGFTKIGWNMDLFSLPKRVRSKGNAAIAFQTFDWKRYAGNAVVEKYIQTFRDYLWWIERRNDRSYDLIHAHHPIAALAMKKHYPHIPVMVTIHSSFETELILNGRIKEGGPEQEFLVALYRELEFNMTRIVTVSQSFKSYLSKYVDHPERIVVIPNGYDEKRFRPVAHDNVIPQLITVCRLVPAKGIDILLQACSDLKRRGHPFMLHIIGDGPARTELERMAEDLNIYDDTIFYGYILHPEQFMPFFDIFALPSRAEAFGSVFAEAALCWLALVGTDVGGISEQIEHGKNGYLVPRDDVQALTEALEKLVTDADLRYRMAWAAREKALNNYSLYRVIEQLKELYLDYVTV